MRHVLSILLQNESGALARVATMFASRGFNIESLSVAPTEDETVSRLTLVTSGPDDVLAQVNKQLAKLVDVVAIADRTTVDHVERELALLKLRADGSVGADAWRDRVEDLGGRILDDEPDYVLVEVTGTEADVDGFIERLPPEIRMVTVVRSGPLAVTRGGGSLGEEFDLGLE